MPNSESDTQNDQDLPQCSDNRCMACLLRLSQPAGSHILASDLEGMKTLLGRGAALMGCGSGSLENESSSSSYGFTCTGELSCWRTQKTACPGGGICG